MIDATQTATTDTAASPFAPRQRKQRPRSPFAAQQPDQPAPPTGLQGPNPTHANQTGMAGQGYRPPQPSMGQGTGPVNAPSYTAQLGQPAASPNPALTGGLRAYAGQPMRAESTPIEGNGGLGGGSGVSPNQGPPVGFTPQDPLAGGGPGGEGVAPGVPQGGLGGNAHGNNWLGAFNPNGSYGSQMYEGQALQGRQGAAAYAQPFGAAATSRLGNLTDPSTLTGQVTADNNPAYGNYQGMTQGLAGNAFGQPSTADQSLALGGQLSGILGSGQVGAQSADANTLGRLGTYQNLTDQTAGNVLNGQSPDQQTFDLTKQYQGLLGSGQVGPAAVDRSRADAYTGAQDQALGALQATPDRQTLATKAFNAQNKVADTATQRQLDEYRSQQAADGRLGLSADKGAQDIITQAQNARDARSAQLALDTASGSVQDQLAKLSATQGLVGQQEGLAAQNRDYATQLGVGNATRQADNASRAAQLGGNTAGLTNQVGLQRLGAAQGLAGDVQGQANLDRGYATDLGVGNANRQAQNAATAYGLGGQTAASSGANQLGRVAASSGLEGQAFGQGQQNIASQTGLNSQQYQQLMGLFQAGNPLAVQPYNEQAAGRETQQYLGQLGQSGLANQLAAQGEAQNASNLGQIGTSLIPIIASLFNKQQVPQTGQYGGG